MAGFDGLNVLVTGAATGLGAATAVGVARNGARRHEKKEEASELFAPVFGISAYETDRVS